jgi:hypothetical protein
MPISQPVAQAKFPCSWLSAPPLLAARYRPLPTAPTLSLPHADVPLNQDPMRERHGGIRLYPGSGIWGSKRSPLPPFQNPNKHCRFEGEFKIELVIESLRITLDDFPYKNSPVPLPWELPNAPPLTKLVAAIAKTNQGRTSSTFSSQRTAPSPLVLPRPSPKPENHLSSVYTRNRRAPKEFIVVRSSCHLFAPIEP